MTQDELDALPVMEEGFSVEERVIDGKTVHVPVWHGCVLFWTAEDEPMLIEDRQGVVWRTGWYDGVQYKRRRREYDRVQA